MKKNSLLLTFSLFTLLLLFQACKEDMDKYQHSPSINIAAGLLPDSVLTVYGTQYDHLNVLDTIQTGDTARVVLRLNGYGYYLTEFSVSKGRDDSKMYILGTDSLKRIVADNSDFVNNVYYFVPGIGGLTVPINYIPGEVTGNDSIVIKLHSDITIKEDNVRRVLRIPVKKRVE